MNAHGSLAALGLVVFIAGVVRYGGRDGLRWPWLVAAAVGLPVSASFGAVGVGLALGHGGLSSLGVELGTAAAAALLFAVAAVGLRGRALAFADDVGLALLAGVAVSRLGCVLLGDLALPSGFDPAPVYALPVLLGAGGAAMRWSRARFGELAGVASVILGVTTGVEGGLQGSVWRIVAAALLLAVGAGFMVAARVHGARRG